MTLSVLEVKQGQLGPFQFTWDTESNLELFREAFLRVWGVMPTAIKEPIEKYCTGIFYESVISSIGKSPMDSALLNKASGVAYWLSDRQSEVRIRSSECRTSNFDGLCNVIAHELRHAWQHATDYVGTLDINALARADAVTKAIEDDAEQFAVSLGFYPGPIWSKEHIRDDADLASLIQSWEMLNPESRKTLTNAAASEAVADREVIRLCWADLRFLDVRDTWEKLTSDQRDDFLQLICEKFPSCK